jgi:urease accessory protein
MNELTIINHALNPDRDCKKSINLTAARTVLAKRRWRGTADDGREFGFDLEEPLKAGWVFYIEGDTFYILQQEPEDIIRIPVTTTQFASRVAWLLGNLHLAADFQPEAIHVLDDPAAVQALTREKITYSRLRLVFSPRATANHHHHHHG